MFHMLDDIRAEIETNVDEYGDSYARDVSVDDLRRIMADMIHPKDSTFTATDFLSELEEHGKGLGVLPGSMFRGIVVRFVPDDASSMDEDFWITKTNLLFAGARVADKDGDQDITHYVVTDATPEVIKSLREKISKSRGKMARIVGIKWLQESWHEKTLLDEERYAVTT